MADKKEKESVLMTLGAMIDEAFGTLETNTVDFKMIHTILLILAKALRILERRVQIKGGNQNVTDLSAAYTSISITELKLMASAARKRKQSEAIDAFFAKSKPTQRKSKVLETKEMPSIKSDELDQKSQKKVKDRRKGKDDKELSRVDSITVTEDSSKRGKEIEEKLSIPTSTAHDKKSRLELEPESSEVFDEGDDAASASKSKAKKKGKVASDKKELRPEGTKNETGKERKPEKRTKKDFNQILSKLELEQERELRIIHQRADSQEEPDAEPSKMASGASIAGLSKRVQEESIIIVERGSSDQSRDSKSEMQFSKKSHVGRLSIVTLEEFEALQKEVRELAMRLRGIGSADFPDNEQLMLELRKGASLTDAMAALQLAARLEAAEKALQRLTELLAEVAKTVPGGVGGMGPGGQIGAGLGGPGMGMGTAGGFGAAGTGAGFGPGGAGGIGTGGMGPGGVGAGFGPGGAGGIGAGGIGPGGVGAGFAPGGAGGIGAGRMGPGGVEAGFGPGGAGGFGAGGMGPGGVGSGFGTGGAGGTGAGGMGPGGIGVGFGPGGAGGTGAGGMGPGGIGAGFGPGGAGGIGAGGMGPGGIGAGFGPGGAGGIGAGGMGPGGIGAGFGPGGAGGIGAEGMGPGGIGAGFGPGGGLGGPGAPGGPGGLGGFGGAGGPGGVGGLGGPGAAGVGGAGMAGTGFGPAGAGASGADGLGLGGTAGAGAGQGLGLGTTGGEPGADAEYFEGLGLDKPGAKITSKELMDLVTNIQDEFTKKFTSLSKKVNDVANNALINTHGLEEKMEKLQAANQLDKIETIISKYTERINKLDTEYSGQLNDFQEKLTQMQFDLEVGLDGMMEALANTTGDPAAVAELNNKFSALQNEFDNIILAQKDLHHFENRLGLDLQSLYTQVEILKDAKCDRDEVEDALKDKAGINALNGLVTVRQFDSVRGDLEKKICVSYDKFNSQEIIWQKAIDDLSRELNDKADIVQVEALRDDVNNNVVKLHKKAEILFNIVGEPRAAAVSKMLFRDTACISCSTPAAMDINRENLPELPAMHGKRPPIPGAEAESQPKEDGDHGVCYPGWPIRHEIDPRAHICRRYCGGSHTLIPQAGKTSSLFGIKTLNKSKLPDQKATSLKPCIPCNQPKWHLVEEEPKENVTVRPQEVTTMTSIVTQEFNFAAPGDISMSEMPPPVSDYE